MIQESECMEDIYDKIPSSLSFVKSTFLILISCLIAFKKVTYRQPSCTSRALAHFFSNQCNLCRSCIHVQRLSNCFSLLYRWPSQSSMMYPRLVTPFKETQVALHHHQFPTYFSQDSSIQPDNFKSHLPRWGLNPSKEELGHVSSKPTCLFNLINYIVKDLQTSYFINKGNDY